MKVYAVLAYDSFIDHTYIMWVHKHEENAKEEVRQMVQQSKDAGDLDVYYSVEEVELIE